MTKKAVFYLLLLTTTASFALGLIPSTVSAPSLATGQIDPIGSTTAPVSRVPKLNPALVAICTCESGQGTGKPQQFNEDGTVRRGKVNPHDIGECQINSDYHQAAAEAMGLNIYTTAGNIEYANWLYEHEGVTPWNWSKSCWLPKPLSTATPKLSTD